MILRSSDGRKVELRNAGDWGSTDPWRFRMAQAMAASGVSVSQDTVMGLPTATYCIRLVAMSTAGCNLQVADCSTPTIPVPHPEAWQYQLLHNPPADELTGFNLIADISSCIEGYGNACLQKIKAGRPGMNGEVIDLRPLDMEKVRIYPDPKSGEKRFDLYMPNKETRTTDASEILHIRGWTPRGGMVGLSPIQAHRLSLGNFVAQSEYLGNFFRNNATPSGYIGLPEGADMDPKDMEEMLAEWEDSHSQDNVHRPAILANGAQWNTIGINLADVAFLDGMRFAVDEMARMLFVPGSWVQPSTAERTSKIEEKFIELASYIIPRGKQITAAFNADLDLFPPTTADEPKLETRFDFTALYHADQDSTSQRILRLRQGGIASANEARIMEGLPPIDDPAYDKPLILPVGAGALPGAEVAGSGDDPNDSGVSDDSTASGSA